MPTEHTPVKVISKERMQDLKSIIHLRGQAKAKVTRIRKAIEEAAAAGAQYDAAQLKVFSRNLEKHFQEYLDLHHQVMAVCPPERMEEQDQGCLIFETHFNETSVLVERAIQVSQCNSAMQPQVQASESPRIIVQQQPLKAPIPTFDGKPENWPRFKAMFLDVMRSSTDSDCIKLYHLERSLVGAAAGIIDARTLNDNNYDHAWEILEDRFENKRVIVDTHIQGLLNLRRMSRENPKELRELIDEVTRHVDGLALIEDELEGVSERFVVNLIASALDKDTRKEWEATIPYKEIPTYSDTIGFLKKRCAILEHCEGASKPAVKTKLNDPVKNPYNLMRGAQPSSCAVTGSSEPSCELCAGVHPNFKCEVLRVMSIPERQAKVRELRLCYNCLRKGHPSSSCSSTRTCQKCQGKHHTLLHIETPSNANTPASDNPPVTMPVSKHVPKPSEVNPVPSVSTTCSVSEAPCLDNSLLMTAVVNILDCDGKYQPCRAFLDCGSQAHFVSRRMIDLLQIPTTRTTVEIIGANGKKSTLSEMAEVQIRSMHSDFQALMDCLVTDRITGIMPSREFDTKSWLNQP
ncbi:uncharacterized protein LOC134289409 [Aedes albopictus]|uniref:CCHC-type domain-containing protein n=1 Tax=Aedes albopictus TaxID=7160 RepID=A0ABM1Z9Y1_AEDAL